MEFKKEGKKPIFTEDELISVYTEQDAVNDGILYDITDINSDWEKGLFNYVTANLLNKGYIKEEGASINVPNLLDLLNQALQIVREKSNNFKNFDHFFSGTIELPSREVQDIFIQQNSTGKFTIMLPKDY